MSFVELSPNAAFPSTPTPSRPIEPTADGGGTVLAYEESGDVRSENELELSGVTDIVEKAYQRAKDRREDEESRWMRAYRNYRGLYGPDTQFTEDEVSKVFVKVTKTKVLAAYSQIIDVLFAGNKFPIGYQQKKFPVDIASSLHFDPKEVTDTPATGLQPTARTGAVARQEILDMFGGERVSDKLREGPGVTPTSATWEPAKMAAEKMEKKVHDQLAETSASKHLRSVAFEMALFGTGIMQGPFAYDKEYSRWNSEGEYEPVFATIPKTENVSIWDFYPDPDARNMDEALYVIRRHRMSKSQLRALKKRPFFRDESIDLAIEYGVSYQYEDWEDKLQDYTRRADVDRYEVLEYWGVIDKEAAELADLEIPEKFSDLDEVQVNIWICKGQILRLVLNPFTPARIPFFVVPYELNPYSMFGVGVAENMDDQQTLMNGFMRLAVDNAALSSNIILEVDENNVSPNQNFKIRPGMVIKRMSGAPGQSVFGTKIPNVTQECFLMFDKARQLADESTGIPSYSHGMSGVMGVGRTASGISMLMGAAAGNIKSVVKNIDDYLLSPLGKAMFNFNMQFNFDEDFAKGDVEVVARGTESLMQNEIRSQRILQFIQLAANPVLAPFTKFDYALRELAKSMDLDSDLILNDPREALIQADMMAKMQQAMGPAGLAGGADPNAGTGNPAAIPSPSDPTNAGGGNIAPGNAVPPGAQGFTGQAPGQQPMPPQM